jgi:predicted outer membrane repeat protein
MKKIIFAATCLLLAFQCNAEIILVKPDGSGDQPTIQAAIDAATDGDEVILAIGTYTGDGNRDIDPNGKAITIRSTEPDDPDIVAATVIDCNGSPAEWHLAFYFHSGEDANTIINGLTITNGWVVFEGGIYCLDSSPAITNCTFSGNSAGYGGAIHNENSNPAITNCTFSGNSAGYGGAIHNENSSPAITNCTFSSNSGYYGGAIYNKDNSNPVIANCAFTGNSAEQDGGVIYNYGGNPAITNCTFSNNLASQAGGVIYNEGNKLISNCTFTGNSAEYGGAIYKSKLISNCTFTGNSAECGGAICNWKGCPANSAITSCTFIGNSAVSGGAIWDTPATTNCTFTGNSAEQNGGAICGGNSSVITNCTFTGNSANRNGGAVHNFSVGNPVMTNCTFSSNSAENQGGAMFNDSRSNSTVTNSILWANEPQEIFDDEYSNTIITYSDVQGGWDGLGNIDINPLFVDPCNGDYHLYEDSPCIDAGDPNYAAGPNETDLDGNPRVAGGIIDMGAYELQPLTPAELLQDLTDCLGELSLHKGIAGNLQSKLNAALRLLEDGNENNDGAAVNLLEAFINAVWAQYDKKIPAAEADILIEIAEEIITLLSDE